LRLFDRGDSQCARSRGRRRRSFSGHPT
jgi:hypothetical protein